MAKELSLKWDDHHGTLIRVFEELLETNTLVDCTIAAEGQYVKAHKMVLSACSPYFQLLFAQENEKNPIVVLKDIKFEELKALIDFMYRGVVKIQEDQLKKFVEVAESLQVKGLAGQNVNTTSQSTANKNAGSKDGRTSPVPRKRRRNNSSNVIEEKRSTFSPPENNSSDSSSHGSNVPCEVALDIPTSSALAAPSSSGISTVASASPVALRPPIEREKLASTSKAKAPSLMVPLPDPETVVKSEPETDEPEPLTEIFLPETKNEEYVDDMALLHSGEGSTEAPPGDSQQSANQYSGFPTMYESSSDSFMQQIADSSNTQGAEAAGLEPLLYVEVEERLQPTPPPPAWGCLAPALHARPKRKHCCSCCGYLAVSISALQKHMRKHTGERPFNCDECGSLYKTADHLKRHRLKHTGEKPYACEHCGKRFAHLDKYKRHKLTHSTDRPFECSICFKNFTRSDNLAYHQRLHTGERPFQCPECGRSFKQKTSLRFHRRNVHGSAVGSLASVCWPKSSSQYEDRQLF